MRRTIVVAQCKSESNTYIHPLLQPSDSAWRGARDPHDLDVQIVRLRDTNIVSLILIRPAR